MSSDERPMHKERIVMAPEIMVGKPVVRGTRIPVELVLKRLAQDLDLTSLFASYPRLTEEDVKACIGFAEAKVRRQRAKVSRTMEKPVDATQV